MKQGEETVVTKTERGPFSLYTDWQNAKSLTSSETTEPLSLRPPGAAPTGTAIQLLFQLLQQIPGACTAQPELRLPFAESDSDEAWKLFLFLLRKS